MGKVEKGSEKYRVEEAMDMSMDYFCVPLCIKLLFLKILFMH